MGKKNDSKMQAHAAWMKDRGIVRTIGRCPLCYRMVGIPMDRHFFGGLC